MGVSSVIITFVISREYNNIEFQNYLTLFAYWNVGSGVYLMYHTLNLKLGDSLELSGCKSCYLKIDNEVYYQEIDV